MDIQTETFLWQGIEIKLVYMPLRWGVISHLQIESINPRRAALPITETGYLSHFEPPDTIEANDGTLVEQVRAFLDERARSAEWQAYLEKHRQLSLF